MSTLAEAEECCFLVMEIEGTLKNCVMGESGFNLPDGVAGTEDFLEAEGVTAAEDGGDTEGVLKTEETQRS